MQLKPKALSPMTATVNYFLSTALAAMQKGRPMPIVPKLPASSLFLGSVCIKIVLPMSIVFAPYDFRSIIKFYLVD